MFPPHSPTLVGCLIWNQSPIHQITNITGCWELNEASASIPPSPASLQTTSPLTAAASSISSHVHSFLGPLPYAASIFTGSKSGEIAHWIMKQDGDAKSDSSDSPSVSVILLLFFFVCLLSSVSFPSIYLPI